MWRFLVVKNELAQREPFFQTRAAGSLIFAKCSSANTPSGSAR